MGKLRVLLVDEHDGSRTHLARLLRMSGYEVATAASCHEARAELSTGSFHLLISEVSPPIMPEFALMRSLRLAYGTRGIVLTAHDLRETRGWRPAGFSCVLRKPIEYERLLAQVRRALRAQSRHGPAAQRPSGPPARSRFRTNRSAALIAAAPLNQAARPQLKTHRPQTQSHRVFGWHGQATQQRPAPAV